MHASRKGVPGPQKSKAANQPENHPKAEKSLLVILYLAIFVMLFAIVYWGVTYLLPLLGMIIPIVVTIAVILIIFAKLRLKFDLFSWLVWFIRTFFRPVKSGGGSLEEATQHLVDLLDALLVKWVVSQLVWIIIVVIFRLDLLFGRFTFLITFVPVIALILILYVRKGWKEIKAQESIKKK
ncbi:MAG: hypothetical protein HY518_04290 [Candidatus Aenigmarchaeota archaeon]|nr:hypothetical protein [Candidatus Aenigmarchaeota archaeon]